MEKSAKNWGKMATFCRRRRMGDVSRENAIFGKKAQKLAVFCDFCVLCETFAVCGTRAAKKCQKLGVFVNFKFGVGLRRETFAVFWRAAGNFGEKRRVFGTSLSKIPKNSAFLVVFAPNFGKNHQKRRVFGTFCQKWQTVAVLGPFLAKKAVSLRRRCLFCILYVICGVFVRFSEKIAIFPGFFGVVVEKPRKLHGFGAIFWAPGRRKRGPRRVCPAN